MAPSKFVNRYSRLDRLLHRVAFSSRGLQVSIADMEDQLYGKQLAQYEIREPVFITALPRAGTTILLSLFHQTGEFVSHTYQSMPFVLCPVFWQRFSRTLRSKNDREMERAHGDGIGMSIDSPEAFEEIIWSHFWRKHYLDDRIRPWRRHSHAEFGDFFRNHMRKQLLLSAGKSASRYLSKNNLNIARVPYIRTLFPDATIIVPFRSPTQHASSLLKQHLNFLRSHAEDPFSKSYMRGIGHYDFGENFLPIDFGDWLEGDRRGEATNLSFWLEYWIAAYTNILNDRESTVTLVSFEQLTSQPAASLERLANTAALRSPQTLTAQLKTLRQPPVHPIDESSLPSALLEQANDLYGRLIRGTENYREASYV